MKNKNLKLSIILGLSLVSGVFADANKTDNDRDRVEPFDIDSIEYIEDDVIVELGFDVQDYLPEGFDPYKIYVDLAAIPYIEEESIDNVDFSKHLPDGFDAYAYPTDVQSINYIDENDDIILDFDSEKYLPKGFDAYKK